MVSCRSGSICTIYNRYLSLHGLSMYVCVRSRLPFWEGSNFTRTPTNSPKTSSEVMITASPVLCSFVDAILSLPAPLRLDIRLLEPVFNEPEPVLEEPALVMVEANIPGPVLEPLSSLVLGGT
jgi:hypothetical protein